MENQKIKYYTSSDGTMTPLKDVEYTHLSFALAKKYRDIFSSSDANDFSKRINEINDIKEEMHKRINVYYENLSNYKKEA